jgi:hypothetical protein
MATETLHLTVTEPEPTSDTGVPQPPDRQISRQKTQRFLRSASPRPLGKKPAGLADHSAEALRVSAYEGHDLDEDGRQNTMVRFA